MELAIESVSKSFPGVQALDGVSLDLKAGEIHALMGENGAGKSTLIKIVTGLLRPDSGRVLLNGRPVAFGSPRDALRKGVSAVHQERNLIPRFSVGENILLERLPVRNGLVDYGAVEREARRYLDLLDPGIDARAEVRSLSVAQMQIVEIAKALSLRDQDSAARRTDRIDHRTRDRRALQSCSGSCARTASRSCSSATSSRKCSRSPNASRFCAMAGTSRRGALLSEMTRQTLVSLMIGRAERVAEIGERRIDPARVVLEARGALDRRAGIAIFRLLSITARSSDCTASSAPDEANWLTRSSARRGFQAANC